MTPEDSELHALVTEVRLLRAEFVYVKEQLLQRNKAENEIFDRLRELEKQLTTLMAQRQPRVNGWTIAAVLIAAALAMITFVNEIAMVTPTQ